MQRIRWGCRGREYRVGSSDSGGDPLRSKYFMHWDQNRRKKMKFLKISAVGAIFKGSAADERKIGQKSAILPSNDYFGQLKWTLNIPNGH